MKKTLFLVFLFVLLAIPLLRGQTTMANVYGRKTISLNGAWKAIIYIDDVDMGDWTAI
jgi:hypothetical protein